MPLSQTVQLDVLTEHLASRRKMILQAWRSAIAADPQMTTARSLSRGQINDHISAVLDAFEHKLRSRPGGKDAQAADRLTKKEEVKHGLHRWQQGYRLPELMREWGHLQLCLFDELDAFAAAQPEIERSTMVEVAREMISLVNEAVSESCKQYERMQQAEARGRMNDLEAALASINEIERSRAALIREAVHDLNGNVLGVTLAAKALGTPDIPDASREELKAAAIQGEVSNVLEPEPGGPPAVQCSISQPGEGIGLSIVKRLCELLDASLEVASSPETGTTFRVVLPLRY